MSSKRSRDKTEEPNHPVDQDRRLPDPSNPVPLEEEGAVSDFVHGNRTIIRAKSALKGQPGDVVGEQLYRRLLTYPVIDAGLSLHPVYTPYTHGHSSVTNSTPSRSLLG